ncbi:MAG: hypothetical protein J6A97_10130 [Clostridia bacterium]|nr:hypothetical protein [Clostridia bacterium]
MNKEILRNVLRTSSVEFSYAEIEKMLNDELEKSTEEMDTELVELCIDVLSNYVNEGNKIFDEEALPKKAKTCKKPIVKKIFLIAAIVSVILTLSITVSANIFDIDLPAEIVKIFGDRIILNLSGGSKENNALDDNGLLSAFSGEKCVIESETFNESRKETIIQFYVKDSKIHGTIVVFPYSVTDKGLIDNNVFKNVEQIKQLVIDGIEVTVTSFTDSSVFASYNTDKFNISILFNDTNIESVVEFLENRTGE